MKVSRRYFLAGVSLSALVGYSRSAPAGLLHRSSSGFSTAIVVLGTTQIQWNNVYFYIEANILAAGDVIEIQSQASGGNWSSLVSDFMHTVTSAEVASYTMNLSGAPTAGLTDSRARVTHAGATTAWSNTITYTVPVQPFVTAPTLTGQGIDSLNGEIVRASIDGTVSLGDTVTWQVQATGGSWSSPAQQLVYTIASADISNGYVSYTVYYNGSCDVRAKATHSGSDSAWSNTATFTLSSSPSATYTDVLHWYQSTTTGGVTSWPLSTLGTTAYQGTRRVTILLNSSNAAITSATIAGFSCDVISQVSGGGGFSGSIISAIVPSGTSTGVVTVTGGGATSGAIYNVDGSLLSSTSPVLVAGTSTVATSGTSTISKSIATLAKGFLLIATYLSSNNTNATIASSAGTPVIDAQTGSDFAGAHMNGLAANAANTITAGGNNTAPPTTWNLFLAAFR